MEYNRGTELEDAEITRPESKTELKAVQQEESDVPAGYEDPHRAALEDNPEHAQKLTWPVLFSALFLGTSFTGPIMFGFILVSPVLVQLSQKLGGANIDFWIPSGWGAAAAVGFSVAGKISDIFGRRIVILSGQLLTVVGGIVCCTSQTMNQLIAGEVILGASIGTVSVAYAGTSTSAYLLMPTDVDRRYFRNSAKQIQGYWSRVDRVQSRVMGCPGYASRQRYGIASDLADHVLYLYWLWSVQLRRYSLRVLPAQPSSTGPKDEMAAIQRTGLRCCIPIYDGPRSVPLRSQLRWEHVCVGWRWNSRASSTWSSYFPERVRI
jgi:hypothetical protein